MSTADSLFLSLLAVVLLVECVWRLSTDAPPGPETIWLVHPGLLVAPLLGACLLLERNQIAFCCAALLVHRGWAAVLRVAPDDDADVLKRP